MFMRGKSGTVLVLALQKHGRTDPQVDSTKHIPTDGEYFFIFLPFPLPTVAFCFKTLCRIE